MTGTGTSKSTRRDDSRTTYKGNSSEVPEDNQETPLLVVHIPGLRNTFLTLAAEMGLARSQWGDVKALTKRSDKARLRES